MTSDLPERLRKVCEEVRRKPYPISDLIPLLQAAADRIEFLSGEVDRILYES